MMQRCRYSWLVFAGIALMVTLGLSGPSAGWIMFERTYYGIGDTEGAYVVQTSDGGYAAVGNVYNGSYYEIHLLKTDSLGDEMWTNTISRDSTAWPSCIQQTADGGYVITGVVEFTGASWDNIFLVKTNSGGDTTWTRAYGGSGYYWGNHVEQTTDGGYIITGVLIDSLTLDEEVCLLRVDSLGNVMWDTTFGGANADRGECVQQTLDGGYIIVGTTESFGAGGRDVYLIKMDSLRAITWERTYGGVSGDVGRSVRQTTDGGYIIGGSTQSFGPGSSNAYMIKTDFLGDTTWTRVFGGASYDGGESVRETADGGYVLAGYDYSADVSGDCFLVKTDSLGSTLWTRSHGRSFYYEEECECVQQTADGGFILVGYRSNTVTWEDSLYMIKTAPNGMSGWHDASTLTIDAPPDTVYVDSTYLPSATVRNLGHYADTIFVYATIDGYSDVDVVIDLLPDSSAQVTFATWVVPPADSATYTMTICVDVRDDIDTTNDCVEKSIFAYDAVGVADAFGTAVQPITFSLNQNEPNPFSNGTTILYSLPYATHVTLDVYDLSGRLVRTLVNETKNAGIHRVTLEVDQGSAGVYFCRLRAGGVESTRKMVVIN